MENKINLQRLSAMLAISTGRQQELCERFLREIFNIAGEELLKGENVRIKGFGTFKIIDIEPRKSVNVTTGEEHQIPGHKRVIFVPSKELADLVNRPFDAFDTVEVDDDVPLDILMDAGEPELSETDASSFGDLTEDVQVMENEPSPLVLGEESAEEEMADMASSSAYSGVYESAGDDAREDAADFPGEVTASEPDDDAQTSDDDEEDDDGVTEGVGNEDDEDDEDDEAEDVKDAEEAHSMTYRRKFLAGFLIGFFVASIIAGIAFMVYGPSSDAKGEKDAVVSVSDAATGEAVGGSVSATPGGDTAAVVGSDVAEIPDNGDGGGMEVATRPSDEPVYDTISTTRFLTTMAKDHYGNFNLWPIIYEENKSFLGHPDRIKPGTRVVIPSLSKYGIDPKNPEHIKEAKRKGIEIYSRYR